MMSRCKLNKHSLSIILQNINNRNTLSYNTEKINVLNNKNNLHKGGVKTLEVEDNNKDEYLVEKEAQSYVIIVGSHENFPDIIKVLWKIVHIVKHLIRLSNSVRNLLRNGMLEISLIPTWCRIWIWILIKIFRWSLLNQENLTLLLLHEEVLR